jgi:hypothetical protein
MPKCLSKIGTLIGYKRVKNGVFGLGVGNVVKNKNV